MLNVMQQAALHWQLADQEGDVDEMEVFHELAATTNLAITSGVAQAYSKLCHMGQPSSHLLLLMNRASRHNVPSTSHLWLGFRAVMCVSSLCLLWCWTRPLWPSAPGVWTRLPSPSST